MMNVLKAWAKAPIQQAKAHMWKPQLCLGAFIIVASGCGGGGGNGGGNDPASSETLTSSTSNVSSVVSSSSTGAESSGATNSSTPVNSVSLRGSVTFDWVGPTGSAPFSNTRLDYDNIQVKPALA